MTEWISTFAEDLFAQLCSAAKAGWHSPRRDRRGWDYLVEFQEPSLPGPPDTHPSSKKAYVQIKSAKRGARLACSVKLSNALRAAQSDDPWFILFVTAVDPVDKSPKIYMVHFWDHLIRRTLESVRRAHNQKAKLHKRTISIGFSDADEQTDGPVEWMQQVLDDIGSDYREKKAKIRDAAGYEDGFYVDIQVNLSATLDDLRANLLGLGEGLSISKFVYRSARFGMLSPEPDLDVSSGILHITPNPYKPCEVRFRSYTTLDWKSLPGQVYSLGIPDLPREEQRLRFSTELFEMIHAGMDKLNVKCNSMAIRSDPY